MSPEDKMAVHLLIGCQYPAFCPWEGVVTIQYFNAEGPKYQSCRWHAASFREDDNYSVRDSGRPSRRLL